MGVDLLQFALVMGPPLLIGALIGFSKGYWTGYRDGFREGISAKGGR